MYELIKNYRHNSELRHSFNELAGQTFGLDFEDWYQNGYWGKNYIPYSIVIDGKVVANVSVNITDMMWNGERKHIIQLGTVMTAEPYRNKGFIRKLMEEIEADYGQNVDGVYLFANDEVLDFYPKFGFEKATEYQYTKPVSNVGENKMALLSMNNQTMWSVLELAVNQSTSQGKFDMVDNSDLLMFYITKFMQETVYYDKALDVYVIAEIEDRELFIHNVFARKKVDLDEVIAAFGKDIEKVTLGFTPSATYGYTIQEINEEDTTLFVKGNVFENYEKEQVCFWTLAHA